MHLSSLPYVQYALPILVLGTCTFQERFRNKYPVYSSERCYLNDRWCQTKLNSLYYFTRKWRLKEWRYKSYSEIKNSVLKKPVLQKFLQVALRTPVQQYLLNLILEYLSGMSSPQWK